MGTDMSYDSDDGSPRRASHHRSTPEHTVNGGASRYQISDEALLAAIKALYSELSPFGQPSPEIGGHWTTGPYPRLNRRMIQISLN